MALSERPQNGANTVLERRAGARPASVSLTEALRDLTHPFWLDQGRVLLNRADVSTDALFSPAIALENLGNPEFRHAHGLRYAYVTGAMANGIASAEIVEAMGQAGMLGFFGAAGLSPATVETNIDRLTRTLSGRPFGCNLIHSPGEPSIETAIADLYVRRGIRLIEASAYLDLTLPVVRYRVHGIHRAADGQIITPNRIVAKVSRVEVASKFMAPPPAGLLTQLVRAGQLTQDEADLARQIPMAQDITAEADSGGHTDNRPAITLIPTMLALAARFQAEHRYPHPLRVGAAGGISTPASVAAAFSMGADYVVTGSINQACVESGSSDVVRQMLAEAEQADTIMAPAADMFEMGVKLQVLKRGTLFAMRAAKLYEIYRSRDSLEALPAAERAVLEKTILRTSIEDIWQQTLAYWTRRDPRQVERAQQDAKHRMALVFRWYLGQSSRWANSGDPGRKIDYQVWCGPAMGAFNEWARGSFLERPAERRVVTLALNLLYGGAVLLRAAALRTQGVMLSPETLHVPPATLHELQTRLRLQGTLE